MKAEQQFADLYAGGDHGFGLIDKNRKSGYDFKHQAPTLETYLAHLEGRISIGIVPINRSGLTKFGVLDIDDHKKDKTKPVVPWSKEKYQKLLDKIKFLRLPLIVSKSKSGGAHCTMFLDKFYKAVDVQHILNKFEYALGYERDYLEKFPKQKTLWFDNPRTGNREAKDGNFINLPYHGSNTRVFLDFAGNELNTSDGLAYVSKRVVNESDWSKFKLLDHNKTTGRNDRTFAATSFFKKHYEDWEDKTLEYNELFNEPPLEEKELYSTVIKSNETKDYSNKEKIETPPTELIDYDISDYRRLDIKEPKFITERLYKERSINFIFGEKGKGKTRRFQT